MTPCRTWVTNRALALCNTTLSHFVVNNNCSFSRLVCFPLKTFFQKILTMVNHPKPVKYNVSHAGPFLIRNDGCDGKQSATWWSALFHKFAYTVIIPETQAVWLKPSSCNHSLNFDLKQKVLSLTVHLSFSDRVSVWSWRWLRLSINFRCTQSATWTDVRSRGAHPVFVGKTCPPSIVNVLRVTLECVSLIMKRTFFIALLICPLTQNWLRPLTTCRWSEERDLNFELEIRRHHVRVNIWKRKKPHSFASKRSGDSLLREIFRKIPKIKYRTPSQPWKKAGVPDIEWVWFQPIKRTVAYRMRKRWWFFVQHAP